MYLSTKIVSISMLFFFFAKPAFASSVVLNEIMANPPTSSKEWVELYNKSTSNIDLTNWTITELTSSNNTNSYNLPSVIIPSNSLCYFEFSSAVLNNSKDTVSLKNSNGDLIDSFTYTSTTNEKTFSRLPDGESWQNNIDPTKTNTDCNSLTSATPSPTPTPTLSPSPSPSITPSPSPQNTFQISNVPSSISSNQSFSVNIQLKIPNLPSQKVYLKGAFKKESGTNYFGLTKYSGNWIRNGESYNKQLAIETNTQGEWSGSIEVMPDIDDSGYTQTENYTFKTTYYTKDGAGPNWSNQTTININHIANKPSSNPSPSPTPSPSSETNDDLVEDLADGISTTSSEIIDEEIIFEEKLKISSSSGVEGIAFQNSSNTKKSNQFSTQLLLIIAGFISLVGAGFWYLRIRRNQLQS